MAPWEAPWEVPWEVPWEAPWEAPWLAPSEVLIEVLCNPSKIIYILRAKHDKSTQTHNIQTNIFR